MAVYKEINRADGSGVTTFYRISDVLDTAETDDQEGQAVIIDYNQAQNKPSINGVTLIGNKTTEDLGLQPVGDYITNDEADEKFIDEDELEAKNYVNQAELQDAIAHIEHFHREIVEALPVTGMDNVLYMVRKGGTGEDIYNEYIWVGLSSSENGYEFLGTTATDLTDYYKKSQVDAALATKVDKEGGKGLSEQNYTLAEKTKLAGLENYDDTEIQAKVSGLNTDVNNLKSSNVTISNTLAELKPDVESNTAAVSTIYDLLDNKMTAIRLVEQGDGWVWMNLEGSRLTYAQASAALGHENCMLFIEQLENDGKVIPAEYKSEGDHINVIFKDLDSLVHIMTCGEDDAIVTEDITTTDGQVDFTVEDEAVGYTTTLDAIYGDTVQATTHGDNILEMGVYTGEDYGVTVTGTLNMMTLNGTQTNVPDPAVGRAYSILSANGMNYQDYDISTRYLTLSPGTYTAKFIYLSGSTTNPARVRFVSGNTNPKLSLITLSAGQTATFTLSEETIVRASIAFKGAADNYKFRVTLTNTDTATDELFTYGASPNPDYPQDIHVVKGNNIIEVTDGDTQINTLPLSLGSIELCKIGTYQDRIYKDSGKWYLEKQIGKVVLGGSEIIEINPNGTNSYFVTLIGINKTSSVINTICNYFRGINYDDRAVRGDNVIYGEINQNKITIRNTTYTSIELFTTFLSTYKPIVYYVLAAPINTEITDTTLLAQLNALEQITQYKHTYITITGADLTPEADFTYIDNVVINNTDLVLGKDTYWNDEVPTQQDLPSNAQEGEIRIVQDTKNVYIYDGTNWIPFDKGGEIDLSNYLAKDNVTAWIPTGDYNPATKKYVDDTVDAVFVPTKTSQLQNDSNFIGKNSNDLTYYYTKTQTYTKSEVDALIGGGGGGGNISITVSGDTLVITTE